mmetsp:Transcript_7074/g.43573  ORF Transcript_7074/g.43573 Transcript_7074/m.43573 type:complete len:172 (-) Transcript_7074:205-720(-)
MGLDASFCAMASLASSDLRGPMVLVLRRCPFVQRVRRLRVSIRRCSWTTPVVRPGPPTQQTRVRSPVRGADRGKKSNLGFLTDHSSGANETWSVTIVEVMPSRREKKGLAAGPRREQVQKHRNGSEDVRARTEESVRWKENGTDGPDAAWGCDERRLGSMRRTSPSEWLRT